MSAELPCHGYADDWSAYLDEELPAERMAELAAHLARCEACRRQVSALGNANEALLTDLAPAEVPADLRARLQDRIDADQVTSLGEARRRRSLTGPLAGLLAAAAAIAIYLAVGGESPVTPGQAPQQVVVDEPETRTAPLEETLPPILPVDETPGQIALATPAPAPGTSDALFDDASAEELAVALELHTIEDLDVIANLELIEALLLLEGGTG